MGETYFRLAATDFGIGTVRLECRPEGLWLEITGDELRTQAVAAEEEGSFSWVLYPPKLYFRNVPYMEAAGTITVSVDEQLLDEYDVALYLLAHYDVPGTLVVRGAEILFQGVVELDGQTMPVHIQCEAARRGLVH